jgi:hypothetical protein
MRRMLRLSVPLLVLLVVVVAVIAAETGRLPAWQIELNKYLEYKSTSLSERIVVLSVDQASRPGRFDREASHTVFGGGVYYRVDHGYSEPRGKGSRPLPYPPNKVYCVLVERDGGEAKVRQALFVALHQDIHSADWVVHEGESEPFTLAFVGRVSRIGCDPGPWLKRDQPSATQAGTGNVASIPVLIAENRAASPAAGSP